MTLQHAIAATRGVVRSSQLAAAHTAASTAFRGSSLAYFNGAFSPPTLAHAHIATSIIEQDTVDVDVLWLDVEPATQHKRKWMDETFDARVAMCDQMIADLDLRRCAGVGTLRSDLGNVRGSSIDLFRTLRALVGPEGRVVWAVGADVIDGMRHWPEKASTFLVPGDTCDGLLVFVRGGYTEAHVHEVLDDILPPDRKQLTVDMLPMPATLAAMSSRAARESLVADRRLRPPGGDEASLMIPSIAELCRVDDTLLDVYADQVESYRKGGSS